jgi:hypothetical protein
MEKKKPDFEVALNGVRLAGWENETDGRHWLSFSPSRRVVDSGSKEVKYMTSFNGVADLVLLREEINQAIAWATGRQSGTHDE